MSTPVPAGEFSTWLSETCTALRNNTGTDVPCGACNACCRSSYFIHIKPGETEALAHIPQELLFPAPGLSEGNVLMGYDEHGHCPMLKNGFCSIYEYRPLTCRSYDCRIFPATGLEISGKDKALVSQQIQRWKFEQSEADGRLKQKALQKAATFLKHKYRLFPEGALPGNPTQLAIVAIKVYDLFLGEDEQPMDDAAMVKAILDTKDNFHR